MSNTPASPSMLTDDLHVIARTYKRNYTTICPQFKENIAWARMDNGKWYLVDRQYVPISDGFMQFIGINEGIALVVNMERKYQYLVRKEDGQLAFVAQFEEVFDHALVFRCGFAVVEKGGKRYHITRTGEPLYDPKKYQHVMPFEVDKTHGTIARVQSKSGNKYINVKGEEIEVSRINGYE